MLDLSVVIGFKDWGPDRLELATRSAIMGLGDLNGEVIVSDYGSTAGPVLRDRIEALGATYVYTHTDGVWSRSRALNAGFEKATGQILVCTDADMLFLPGSFEVVHRRLVHEKRSALVLQCRDLPEGYSEHEIQLPELDWQALRRASRLRPRWGMGGMIAVSRESFADVRGLDERMEIYGGEDIDFAQRLSRSGTRVQWLVDEAALMYHMWHPPSRTVASTSVEGATTISRNRDIMLNDESMIRNVPTWSSKPRLLPPLVSVVISTRNRASFLGESVNSVLAQSFQDFEVIVVDDGSDDSTAEVMQSFEDRRVRFFRREHSGLAAARNFAATVSLGKYTVIHDDDDIMLPWRIESHLAAMRAGDHGSYGGWVDFDDLTGLLTPNYGKHASLATLLFGSRVYAHGTLMLATDVLRAFGYDESLRSGSDYNLGVRMMRSGISLRHTGKFHIARRLHRHQVTVADTSVQGLSARATLGMALESFGAADEKLMRNEALVVKPVHVDGYDDLAALVGPYLPAHLTSTNVLVASDEPLEPQGWDGSVAECRVRTPKTSSDFPARYRALISDASHRDLARLRALEVAVTLSWVSADSRSGSGQQPASDMVSAIFEENLQANRGHVIAAFEESGVGDRNSEVPPEVRSWNLIERTNHSGAGLPVIMWKVFANLNEAVVSSASLKESMPRLRPMFLTLEPSDLSTLATGQ